MKTGKHTSGGPYIPLADILRGHPTIASPRQVNDVRQAIEIAGEGVLDADIVVIESHQIRFGWFADLGVPHPCLEHSVRVLRDGRVLPGVQAGAIYHHMEEMIPHDHPLQPYYQELTAFELEVGLLPATNGSPTAWNKRVRALIKAGVREARRSLVKER